MEGKQLYLKPDEAKFLSMAVLDMLEYIQESRTDVTMPWTPEARKDMKEMAVAGTNLKIKMQKLGFDMRPMPPYVDGDEKDFFTKPS